MLEKLNALLSYIRLWLLPRRRRLALSVAAGLLAMLLSSGPMWWGVLFSPLSQPLTAVAETEEAAEGFSFQIGGQVFRFKALDLIFEILSKKS